MNDRAPTLVSLGSRRVPAPAVAAAAGLLVGWTSAEAHAAPAELLRLAAPVIDRYRGEKETEFLAQWEEEAGRKGRAAAGWEATLEAASDARVDLLLFQDGVDHEGPVRVHRRMRCNDHARRDVCFGSGIAKTDYELPAAGASLRQPGAAGGSRPFELDHHSQCAAQLMPGVPPREPPAGADCEEESTLGGASDIPASTFMRCR